MKRTSREPSALSEPLLRHLNSYALAAGAAGVGVLALAQPAEAKVVYTPAHKIVPINDILPLDLNHDGAVDFNFANVVHGSTTPGGDYLGVEPPVYANNEVWARPAGAAAALPPGFLIKANKGRFREGSRSMASVSTNLGQGSVSRGPWKNASHRYLGLKFFIKGKIHYGWARLDVHVANQAVRALLTGYAYETIPNKPIIAGKTTGPDVITLQPGSLGRLAQGSAGR